MNVPPVDVWEWVISFHTTPNIGCNCLKLIYPIRPNRRGPWQRKEAVWAPAEVYVNWLGVPLRTSHYSLTYFFFFFSICFFFVFAVVVAVVVFVVVWGMCVCCCCSCFVTDVPSSFAAKTFRPEWRQHRNDPTRAWLAGLQEMRKGTHCSDVQ